MKAQQHFEAEHEYHKGMSADHAGLSVVHQECADACEGDVAKAHKEMSEYHASIAVRHEKHADHFRKCLSEGVNRKADYNSNFAKAHEDQLMPPAASGVSFPVFRKGQPGWEGQQPSTTSSIPVFKQPEPEKPNPAVPAEFEHLFKANDHTDDGTLGI